MGDRTQWHLRQAQPSNPIVFFGEASDTHLLLYCCSVLVEVPLHSCPAG